MAVRQAIIIISLVLFLGFNVKNARAETGSKQPENINYYYEEKLRTEESEALLNAAGMLLVAGLIFIKPEALEVLVLIGEKGLRPITSDKLFDLVNRLL